MKKSKVTLALLALQFSTGHVLATDTGRNSDNANATIIVKETITPDKVTEESVFADELKKIGANNFGNIMRYQPLISAFGSNSGSRSGKKSFDRGGYTGYNIRGLDGNRISLDVDGIPLPDATGRSYDPTTGEDTFGIGRDYIDPYLYGRVNITSGSASQNKIKNVVGGSVSFVSKSPDDYLIGDKPWYASYSSGFDNADHSWHNGITSAFGNSDARILLAYSRRDGQQTRNNSDYLASYPMRWNSDSFLLHGVMSPDDTNRITGMVDFYHKSSRGNSPMWKKLSRKDAHDTIVGDSAQKNSTQRYAVILGHEFTPDDNIIIDKMENKIFYQQTHVNDTTFDDQHIATMSYWGTPETEKTLTFSGLNTQTFGLNSEITKQYGIQTVNYGVNFLTVQTTRPFRQVSNKRPTMQPQADSNTYDVNIWLGDIITRSAFSAMPGLKYSWHKIKSKGFAKPDNDSALGSLTLDELNQIHSKDFISGELLPSLTLMYTFNDSLSTYLQYKRGVSYPTNSQISGIWLHGKIGPSSPAMVGNPDLKTETSNQFEWGLAGKLTSGVTLRGSVFYNSYDNFIYIRRYKLRNYQTGEVIPGNESLIAKLPASISDLFLAENRDNAYIYGAELTAKISYGKWFSSVDGLSSTLAVGYSQGKSKSSYAGDGWVELDSVLPVKGSVSIAFDDPQNVMVQVLLQPLLKVNRR